MAFCGAISGKLSEFEKTVSLTNILQKTNEFKGDCKQNDEFVHNDSFYVNAVMLTAEKKGVRMGGVAAWNKMLETIVFKNTIYGNARNPAIIPERVNVIYRLGAFVHFNESVILLCAFCQRSVLLLVKQRVHTLQECLRLYR